MTLKKDQSHIHLLQETPTNNPYIDGAKLLYTRLKWDLKPESWSSRKSLKKLHNSRKGEKAVILCNGPSLNRVDFEKLTGIYTFGLNNIYKTFDRMDFRPSCLVMADELATINAKPFLKQTDLPLFLTHKAHSWIGSRANITYMHEVRTKKFARDLSMSFFGGYTVTYVAIQLAYHMGFSQVALVGCDHNYFPKEEEKFVRKSFPKNTKEYYVTDNYNDNATDAYFVTTKNENEYGYRTALDYFRIDDRGLYNATEGGKLEVLPRITLQDFLAS